MTVKELIERLKEFPQDMEVHYDIDDGYSTYSPDELWIGNAYYNSDEKKVVIIW